MTMASPLASSSRCVLNNIQRRTVGGGKVLARATATTPVWQAQPGSDSAKRSFSRSSAHRAEGDSQGVSPSKLEENSPNDFGESMAAQGEAGSTAHGISLTSAADAASLSSINKEQDSKAYYDSLLSNQRAQKLEDEQRLRHLRQARLKALGELGSTQTRETAYRPHKARLTPLTAKKLTISHLMAATAHLGHAVGSVNKAFIQYLYGTRNGLGIIDVERYTIPAIRTACKVIEDVVFRDGVVLFLDTREGTQRAVIAAAKRLGDNGFHMAGRRWLPGTLSNSHKVMAKAIVANVQEYEEALAEQKQIRNSSLARQERSDGRQQKRRKNADEEDSFDPINLASQKLRPDLMVVMNPKENRNAISEATQFCIPTIGVVDTDVDPRVVTYAIPANDESVRTAELIVGLLSKAGEEGLKSRKRLEEEIDRRRAQAAQREQLEEEDRQSEERSESDEEEREK